MSTIMRTLRNMRRVGLKSYGIQMHYIGDTKAGTFVAADRFGNKYFENLEEELPLRTRWVEYSSTEVDPSAIEPGWHAWISYLVDKPPTDDTLLKTGATAWALPEHRENPTQSRGAYRPYSTTRPKINAWEPVARARW